MSVCSEEDNKDKQEVCCTLRQRVCRTVPRITEASGLSLTHREEDLLKCESYGPDGPIIVHY